MEGPGCRLWPFTALQWCVISLTQWWCYCGHPVSTISLKIASTEFRQALKGEGKNFIYNSFFTFLIYRLFIYNLTLGKGDMGTKGYGESLKFLCSFFLTPPEWCPNKAMCLIQQFGITLVIRMKHTLAWWTCLIQIVLIHFQRAESLQKSLENKSDESWIAYDLILSSSSNVYFIYPVSQIFGCLLPCNNKISPAFNGID